MNKLRAIACVIFSISLCLTGCVSKKHQDIDKYDKSTDNTSAQTNNGSDDNFAVTDNQPEAPSNADLDPDTDIITIPNELPYSSRSLWPILIKQYQLTPRTSAKLLKQDILWFKRYPKFLSQSSENSRRYLYYITAELVRRKMPGELAMLPMIESNYKARTRAASGHEGLWQIGRGTGKRLGLQYDWWYNGAYDVVASTDAALNYVEKLGKHYDNDWLLAMAAYNCGSGTLDKIIAKNRSINPHTQFWQLPLPAHTRDHLKRLLALSVIVANPERYGVEPITVENRQYFYATKFKQPVDMTVLAHLSKTSLSEIQLLNPGFVRDSTDPLKSRRVLLPIESPRNIQQQVAEMSEQQRFNWPTYTVTSSDSLSKIAKRNGTTMATLRQINGLGNSAKLSTDSTLILPASRRTATAYKDINDSTERKTSSSQKVHRVASGESLWVIARKYKTTTAQLQKLNNLKPNQVLNVGDKLIIKAK
jgi:membrane-bound lytic murein transglycosylase D